LCPTDGDLPLLEPPIRACSAAGGADQAALLAKMLFTNSFGCLLEGEQVRESG